MNKGSQTLALDGVHCANCVLKIERCLAELPGVELARGNATQRRLQLVWDEDHQSIDALKQKIRDLGYEASEIGSADAKPSETSLLPRLALAALGTMNIMAFSLSVWFGQVTDMGPGTMQFMHWLSAAIALPVMVYSGAVFHRPALRALRAGHMTMDTPITLAIWITFAGSLFETIRGAEDVYFDAVVSLIFFLLIGRVLEQAMRRRSACAAGNLREMMEVDATLIDDAGRLVATRASALRSGDRVQVQTGMRVPADGILTSANGAFDESALTGETMPRTRKQGEAVAAGAILIDGPVELTVTHVGSDSELGKIAQMIDDISSHKGHLQRLSDQFARGYIPLVLLGGAFGFLLWFFIFGAPFAEALKIAIAVLIVTCPCAAGLATPAVSSRAADLALQQGVIIKSGEALEALAETNMILLDKTGTASTPSARLNTTGLDPETIRDVQALAAASTHPKARAIVGESGTRPAEGVKEHKGLGVQSPSGARLGSAAFIGVDASLKDQDGLFYQAPNGQVVCIPIHEAARPDMQEFLQNARSMNIEVALHSGDTKGSVSRFAQTLGIDAWTANQRPNDKLTSINEAKAKGAHVMMIGDGINDAVALSGADVSVSFAGATDIAQSAASIVLTRPQLSLVPWVITLARSAQGLIKQNLAFATLYNVLTVPLALAGFLTPAIAALLMSSSSIIVLANGFRLRARS